MPPTLHAAIYAGLLDAGVDAPRVSGEKLPTDDDGNYNPVAELALLWGSLSAGVAKDLEEQIATAEAQLQASSAGDGPSQPQSAARFFCIHFLTYLVFPQKTIALEGFLHRL